jgi:hypothetical protein
MGAAKQFSFIGREKFEGGKLIVLLVFARQRNEAIRVAQQINQFQDGRFTTAINADKYIDGLKFIPTPILKPVSKNVLTWRLEEVESTNSTE